MTHCKWRICGQWSKREVGRAYRQGATPLWRCNRRPLRVAKVLWQHIGCCNCPLDIVRVTQVNMSPIYFGDVWCRADTTSKWRRSLSSLWGRAYIYKLIAYFYVNKFVWLILSCLCHLAWITKTYGLLLFLNVLFNNCAPPIGLM